ncbi:hypothetical protein MKW92_044468 [Papaver armeniacum]|nr:hypothetical protein MKW92_044468 [Papaver armeniacum]
MTLTGRRSPSFTCICNALLMIIIYMSRWHHHKLLHKIGGKIFVYLVMHTSKGPGVTLLRIATLAMIGAKVNAAI